MLITGYVAFNLFCPSTAVKTSSEVEGYRVALEAIRELHLGSVRGDMTFISSTPGKVKKPESLGEPHYTAGDGCRAWVIKTP